GCPGVNSTFHVAIDLSSHAAARVALFALNARPRTPPGAVSVLTGLASAKLNRPTVLSAAPMAARAAFFEIVTAPPAALASGKARSLAPLVRFHSLTTLSSPPESRCVAAGIRVRLRTGAADAGMTRAADSVLITAVLSSLPEMIVVLLAWNST